MRRQKNTPVKHITSFIIKNIPRKYLQLFSHVALKIIAIFYRGNKVECPVCGNGLRKFLPYGRVSRENALCPNCLALERHRVIWVFLKKKTDFFTNKKKVLHIAPEACFIDRFEALHGDDYITVDLESPLAKVKADIHHMPFEENTFEAVFCNHVMEHVADDIQAMKEILRVMKPGGFAIIQIPFFIPVPDVTIEDPSVTDPKERYLLYGQDDHVRMYGKDYPERLRSAGFHVSEEDFVCALPKEMIEKHGLLESEVIYYCTKQ